MQKKENTPLKVVDVRFKNIVSEIVLRYDHVPGVFRIPLRSV
jgi:hypothetical protein